MEGLLCEPSSHQSCCMIPCRQVDTLQKRIVVLERDPRVTRLVEVAEEFAAHKKAMAEQHRAVEAKMEVYHNTVGWGKDGQYKGRSIAVCSRCSPMCLGITLMQLSKLDNKVDKGPPGLWKVTEEVRASPVRLLSVNNTYILHFHCVPLDPSSN